MTTKHEKLKVIIQQAAQHMDDEMCKLREHAAELARANTQAQSAYDELAAKYQRLQAAFAPARGKFEAFNAQNTALRSALASANAENEALRVQTRLASSTGREMGERPCKRSRSSGSDPNEVEHPADAASQQAMDDEQHQRLLLAPAPAQEASVAPPQAVVSHEAAPQAIAPQEAAPQAVTPQEAAPQVVTSQVVMPGHPPPRQGFMLDDDDDDDDDDKITIHPDETTVVLVAPPPSASRPELVVQMDEDSDDGESRTRWGEHPPPPMRCTCELDDCSACNRGNPCLERRREMDKDGQKALMFSGCATSTGGGRTRYGWTGQAAEEISFSLHEMDIKPSSAGGRLEKPYLRTSARLTVAHLKQYLAKKMGAGSGVGPASLQILCRDKPLPLEISLDQIVRSHWRDHSSEDLMLTYRVLDVRLDAGDGASGGGYFA